MSEPAFTPGPWVMHGGFSDWGMPRVHMIYPEGVTDDYDRVIAEVPSITPYCIGASRKERERSGTQRANAILIAEAPTLYAVAKAADEFVSAILEKRGEMNDAAYPAGLQALPLLKQIRAALGKVEGEGK